MSLAESPSFYLISFCHRISRKTIALSWLHIQSGEGRGEYSGFQVTGMIERGQKSKPKKSLGLQTNSRKIPEPKFHAEFPSQNNLFAELRGRDTWNYLESWDCFEYPKKCLLKSSYPEKYLPKFSNPKISWNRKFETPPKSLIIPVTLNPEYPSPLGQTAF